MGWTFQQATHYKGGRVDRKAECDAYFMEGLNEGHFKVLASSLVGSVYYAAVQDMVKNVGKGEDGKYIYEPIDDGEVWAAVFLTIVDNKDFCNFGYKDMDESMHPGYYDCPKKILKLLSPTECEWANEWRQKCYEQLRAPKLSDIKIGEKIIANGEVLLQKMPPAYQFKTPWFKRLDCETPTYFKKKSIFKWEYANGTEQAALAF